MLKKEKTYIDLFCGAGGFSVGFDKAGFNNIFSIDSNKGFCKTYRRNFPSHLLIEKDISDLTKEDIEEIVGGRAVDVIIGGPPCQGFSIAGNIGRTFADDPRNHLFKEFVRVVDLIKPSIFVMENVARLYTHNAGNTRREITSSFESIGYKVECKVLNSADYGVPQVRKRTVFIGTRLSRPIDFPSGKGGAYRTVATALEGLPPLQSGQKDNVYPNHVAMKHSAQMLKKMGFVKDGGDRSSIPPELRPVTGDARKYIRYNSNRPSVTVTGDMRKIFHYSQNRALTVRELARLQSFDDNFIFEDSAISQQQQVGNSVPPLMAGAIAESVIEMLG